VQASLCIAFEIELETKFSILFSPHFWQYSGMRDNLIIEIDNSDCSGIALRNIFQN